MLTLLAVARIDLQTRRPVLVFHGTDRHCLATCYTRSEQHSSCSREWYSTRTRAPYACEAEAVRLLCDHYDAIGLDSDPKLELKPRMSWR